MAFAHATVPAASADLTPSARALAPDLARGGMLLFIALANVHFFLYGHLVGIRAYPMEQHLGEQIVTVLQMCFVDGRAYPMFAALFGYGIVQLTRRRIAAGHSLPDTRRLVRRRGRWMLLFGFVHALLLFSGDIIGPYGLLAVIFAGLVLSARDRTLLIMAACWLLPAGLLGGFMSVPLPGGETAQIPSAGTTNPLLASLIRPFEWLLMGSFQTVLLLVPALLLGAWAARHRVLEEPGRHYRMLWTLAVTGVGGAALAGLPVALIAARVWSTTDTLPTWATGALHTVSGFGGGLGYAAVAGLLVAGGIGHGRIGTALAACGQRSMTCYLWQSVIFVALLASYGGGLGDRVGVVGAAAIAVVTWATGVVLAEMMRRCGMRGPFEVLLRRLTYRQSVSTVAGGVASTAPTASHSQERSQLP